MNVSTEGWRETLLEAFIKFRHVIQLCLLDSDDADEVVIGMFRNNSLCPLCRKAGFIRKEVPNCRNCLLTGFGQKPEFSCISQHDTGVTTVMNRFVAVLDDVHMEKRKRRELLSNLAGTIAERLHKASGMSTLRELEDFVL